MMYVTVMSSGDMAFVGCKRMVWQLGGQVADVSKACTASLAATFKPSKGACSAYKN
jgi:hypothetical protein